MAVPVSDSATPVKAGGLANTGLRRPIGCGDPVVGGGDLPATGDIVHVRSRRYLVDEVLQPPQAGSPLVQLSCLEDDSLGEDLGSSLGPRDRCARARPGRLGSGRAARLRRSSPLLGLHATRGARRTEAAALAGKGDQHLVVTGGAAHAGKAVREDAASEVPFELRSDEPG